MKRFNKFINNARYIFKPRYWLMNYPYSEELDAHIRRGLLLNEVELYSEFHCRISGVKIWIGNFPFAYATLEGWRASRSTIDELRKKILTIKLASIRKELDGQEL